MPQVVGFFALPGALTIFGVSVGSIFTAVAIGGSVLSLAKKPGKIGDRGRAIELSTDPNAPVGVAYGRTATAGSMVFQDVTNQNQDLSIIIAISNAGPIDAIEEVRLDDAPVTVDWATGNVTGKYAGYMRFEKRPGNNTEAAYSLSGISSFWSSTAKGENVASAWWALGWKDGLWNTGIPSALFVLRGIKMYDPRKDSTAGGVGTHRITDPATWEWSQNPALCALHYLIGVSENGKRTFGLHVPTPALDLPAFAVAADRCDELVSGKPRFTCGGMVYSTDDPEAVLDAFGAVMGGAVFQSGGLFTCIAGGPQTATITLTDDDLAGPLEVTSAPSWREVSNTVTVNFTDPGRDWRENTTAPITDALFVAEDDGRELPDEVNLLMCNDADAAHRLGRLWLTNNREARTYSARFKPVAWGLKPGMVCNFATAAFGITEKVMVTNCTRNADGTVDLVLRTETDAKYAASDNFAQAMPQHQKVTRYDPLVVDTPALADWTLTPVFDADPTKTGIRVVGDTPSTINRILRVEKSVDGGVTWLLDRDIELDNPIDLIVPVAGAGKAVKIGLTYFNAFGSKGTRFISAQTTSALSAPTGLAAAPTRIQEATGRDFGLDVTAADPADWRAETFEVEVQSTLSGLWDKPGGKSTAETRRVLTPKIGSNLTVDVRGRFSQKDGTPGPWTTITAAAQFPDFESDGALFFIQATAPVNPQVGWIWANSADNFKQFKWSGTAWDLWFDPNAKLDKIPASLLAPIATSLTSQAIVRRAGAGLDKNGAPIAGTQTSIENKFSFAPPASTEVHALALELEVTLNDLTIQSFFAAAGAPTIKDTVDVTTQSNSSLSSARARFIGISGVNSAWVTLSINTLSGITSQADGPGLSIQGDVSVDGGAVGDVLVNQGTWWKTTKYDYTHLNNIPTTLAGYGITNADTSAQVNAKVAAKLDVSGSANLRITNATPSVFLTDTDTGGRGRVSVNGTAMFVRPPAGGAVYFLSDDGTSNAPLYIRDGGAYHLAWHAGNFTPGIQVKGYVNQAALPAVINGESVRRMGFLDDTKTLVISDGAAWRAIATTVL